MTITDAQIHLWEADSAERPWPKGVKPNLVEPMTAERALSMMDELGIDRAVIAPPAVCGFDPSYAIECAQKYPDRAGTLMTRLCWIAWKNGSIRLG